MSKKVKEKQAVLALVPPSVNALQSQMLEMVQRGLAVWTKDELPAEFVKLYVAYMAARGKQLQLEAKLEAYVYFMILGVDPEFLPKISREIRAMLKRARLRALQGKSETAEASRS
jgi:hypothetical protein